MTFSLIVCVNLGGSLDLFQYIWHIKSSKWIYCSKNSQAKELAVTFSFCSLCYSYTEKSRASGGPCHFLRRSHGMLRAKLFNVTLRHGIWVVNGEFINFFTLKNILYFPLKLLTRFFAERSQTAFQIQIKLIPLGSLNIVLIL